MVVENLHELTDEEALLHLFNFVSEMGGDLLLTSREIPNFKLPDLQSRLNMISKAEIMMPDESVIRAVANKAFKDRHILVDDAVLAYLSMHLTRSFSLLQQVIERADKLSLEVGRKITIPILKQVIQELKGDEDV
jgi:chromosomal replication initiation ATPase DnaA